LKEESKEGSVGLIIEKDKGEFEDQINLGDVIREGKDEEFLDSNGLEQSTN
jgi:hypothetical protein